MRDLLRLNRHKHRINLCSSLLINTKIIVNLSTCLSSCTRNKITTSRISTHPSNHTRKEGVVETLEEEVEEEDLVEEEAKLRSIIMDNWVTTLGIA